MVWTADKMGETEGSEIEVLLRGAGRIRRVLQGPHGYLYALKDEGNAPLLRLGSVGTR
jgi:glucose/arabinose dehydrogenase